MALGSIFLKEFSSKKWRISNNSVYSDQAIPVISSDSDQVIPVIQIKRVNLAYSLFSAVDPRQHPTCSGKAPG